ncbi:MAG: hypothetical protein AAF797_08045 [Planctomycetota bacterium]
MELQYVLIPIIVFAVIVVVIFQYFNNKARREELARWADARGWTLELGKDKTFDDRFPQFKLLQRGSSRYADEILYGQQQDGREVLVFRYHYTTGGGKNQQQHVLHAALLRLPFTMPELIIRPEGLFDKLKSAFGLNDIDFESAEFSRRFAVHCPDRRLAHDLIPPETIEFLLARATAYTLEAEGDHLLITNEKQWGLRDIDPSIAIATGFLDRIPPGVIAHHQEHTR